MWTLLIISFALLMGRYQQTGPDMVKEPPLQAGDIGFLGVNNRLDPSQLEPGLCADAVNKRFTHGVAGDRKGIRKLNWLNRVALAGDTRTIDPYGVIYGVGKFRDPNGMEWDVVAADGQVYASRENQYPAAAIPLPAGVTITNPVTFTQAFNVLIMFRGPDLPELQLEHISEGFKAITTLPNTISGAGTENTSDGTEAIPNADRGLFFQNRVFIPYQRDLLAVSDYLNYTRYSPIRSAFRINQGSSDALVALGRFNETTLIAFKEQSIYAIGNITGNLDGATLYEITSEYGCIAPKSIVAVGKDLWFLADKRGICSITLTEQNKIQGVNVPVSQDIQKTIDRINWRYAAGATAAYWQNRLYVAVPIDTAEVCKGNLAAGKVFADMGGEVPTGAVQIGVRVGRLYRWTAGSNEQLSVTQPPLGFEYDGTPVSVPVTAGKSYRWWPDPFGRTASLINGTPLISGDGNQTFIAQGNSVTLNVSASAGFSQDRISPISTVSQDLTPASDLLELLGPVGATAQSRLCPLFKGINNAVLIYDFQNAKWSGHDESAVLMVKDWALTTVDGRQRLVFFSADGTLNLYEEGAVDENIYEETQAPIVPEPISWQWTSRGYLFDTLDPKSFLRVMLSLATLNPNYTVELLTDGAGETFTLVSNRTKNRLKYYRPHDAADWVPDNSNGDYLAPFREDYAWILGENDQIYLDTKIDPERLQEVEEKFWAKGRGKYAQVKLTGTGRVEVRSLNLEAVLASKRFGVHA